MYCETKRTTKVYVVVIVSLCKFCDELVARLKKKIVYADDLSD